MVRQGRDDASEKWEILCRYWQDPNSVADPCSGRHGGVAWDCLPMIMKLCSDIFIVNYFDEMLAELGVEPDDFESLSHAIKRKTGVEVAFTQMMARGATGNIYWAVIRKVS
jgi:hypothetical protein